MSLPTETFVQEPTHPGHWNSDQNTPRPVYSQDEHGNVNTFVEWRGEQYFRAPAGAPPNKDEYQPPSDNIAPDKVSEQWLELDGKRYYALQEMDGWVLWEGKRFYPLPDEPITIDFPVATDHKRIRLASTRQLLNELMERLADGTIGLNTHHKEGPFETYAYIFLKDAVAQDECEILIAVMRMENGPAWERSAEAES